jgi:hypothetical protein
MQKSPALTNPAVWPLPQRQPKWRSRIVQLKTVEQQRTLRRTRYDPSPETVGGIWLAMSAIVFIFVAALVKPRQETTARNCLPDHLRASLGHDRKLDYTHGHKKSASSNVSAPLEKAA